ncbi:hypothetical protein L4X63_09780 [Geomonas sp. Red32]|uniref:hypothetical protein n=1 Tax=Geomonas sp. Red32 TaxID=2912856 RepID=UPI00202CD164|nr:hypothetical protein [Geomonas sp. Red32]MCM0081879.1 hypothetical protein [Geomonas sp. Red32]
MSSYRLFILFLLLAASTLTGCSATLKELSQIPEPYQLSAIGKADTGKPFAISSRGQAAVISDGGVKLIALDKEQEPVKVTPLPASALAFSPEGDRLAVAIPAEGARTDLRIFDTGGKTVAESSIPAQAAALAWTGGGRLAVLALELKRYSFGTLVNSVVFLWDGKNSPVSEMVGSVTLRPPLSKLPDEAILQNRNLAASPFGDEIAYTVLRDPPMFTPYQKVITRHLATGRTSEVADTSVNSQALLYFPDGDTLLIGNGQGMSRRVTIPDGKEIYAWPSAGAFPAISPGGSYLYLDGRLYQDGNRTAYFPEKTRGVFLPDGSALLLSWNGTLYRLSGLNEMKRAPRPTDPARFLELRRLRAQGLIEEKEYRDRRGRMLVK